MNTFAELGLSKPTLDRLEQIGFTQPTEIQAKTTADILCGKDLMASAETGSGKTAAYVLPLLERLPARYKGCVVLVLVPTRELAVQVRTEFERFMPAKRWGTAAIYGGCGYYNQLAELRKNPAIVIATPGRLLDLLDQKLINLSGIKHLVLDEADRLMDLGFMPQVRKIVARIPEQRQTVMFSATFDKRVEGIAQEYLIAPVRVEVKGERLEPISIEQQFHHLKEADKDGLLVKLVGSATGSVIVFTRTRRRAKKVATSLRGSNIQAKEIHGDISQNQREKTIQQYRMQKFNVLVATDIAARGLDIPAISDVINYDLPQCAEDYVHRIGRTGRAGRSGCSHTFVAEQDGSMLRQIERIMGGEPERPQPSPSGRSRRNGRPRGFAPRLRSAARR